MNHNQPSSATDLGFARWPGFAIPALRVLGFAIPLLLLLLTACAPGRHERMEQELLRARKMNKEYVSFTVGGDLHSPDSVMREVADYYDHHGTPNEQMEAHYLLGCVYRDMGEAPRAIDCYLDAAACADTTAADCDFYMLASIHAQMAWLYHQQLLLSYEVEAHRKASHYNYLAKDTFNALYEQRAIAGVYILEGINDSAEMVLLNVSKAYMDNGFLQEALLTSTILMSLYAEKPERANELKALIDRYDAESEFFDEHHELPPGKRLFYGYKAKWFETAGQLDSAECYFRKMHQHGMPWSSRCYMYNGLLGIFEKEGEMDSVAKYAKLYCEASDSSVSVKDQEAVSIMAASYNYNNIQKEAFENERKVTRRNNLIAIMAICTVMVAIIGWRKFSQYRIMQRQKQQELKRRHKEEQRRHKEERQRQKYAYEEGLKRLADRHHEEKVNLEAEYAQKGKDMELRHRKEREELQRMYAKEKDSLLKELKSAKEKQNLYSGIENAKNFADTEIYKKFLALSKSPLKKPNDSNWKKLTTTFSYYYPQLYKDVCQIHSKNNTIRLRICILTVMGIANKEQSSLLCETKQNITNNTAAINEALFGEKIARTFYVNLKSHYNIV